MVDFPHHMISYYLLIEDPHRDKIFQLNAVDQILKSLCQTLESYDL